ncbi:MAG: AbiV family abortive infection protein [Planctomycetota bacterium]
MTSASPELTTSIAWSITTASFKNAWDYLKQARLLSRNGYHGRARSLAILGQEELGKTLYFWNVSVGALRFEKGFARAMFREHEWKQRFLHMLLRMLPRASDDSLLQRLLEPAMPILKKQSPALEDLEALVQLVPQLRAHWESMEAEIEPFLEPIGGVIQDTANFSAQDAKHEGLYVSLAGDGVTVTTPAEVDEGSANDAIDNLQRGIVVLRSMQSGMDANAAAMVREILGQRRRCSEQGSSPADVSGGADDALSRG